MRRRPSASRAHDEKPAPVNSTMRPAARSRRKRRVTPSMFIIYERSQGARQSLRQTRRRARRPGARLLQAAAPRHARLPQMALEIDAAVGEKTYAFGDQQRALPARI